MNSIIFGIWGQTNNEPETKTRCHQFFKAWGMAPDSEPLLDAASLKLWSTDPEASQHGWRGDLFFLCSGIILDILVPIPDELKDDTLGQFAHLYGKYGESFPCHINGAFSLVVYDRNADLLRIIQSRNPDSAAYNWSVGQWGTCFSNRVRPILSFAPEIAEQSSPEGLYQLLFRSNIIAPKTFYDRISQVPFGSLLRAETDTLVEYDPWHIPEERISDEGSALEEFENLLTGAMDTFMSRAKDPVFLLSGGYDSSVNVALGAKMTSEKLITIGIGAKKYNTDAPYARMVAEHVGSDHREYLFDGDEVEKLPSHICNLEAPYFEPGMLLTCTALELARANGQSAIGGEGTDQVFGSCVNMAYARHTRSSASRRFLRQFFRTVAHNPITRTNVFLSRLENRLMGPDNINTWCGAMGFRDSDIREMVDGKFWKEYNYDSQEMHDQDLESMMLYGCQVLDRDYLYYGILPICGRVADNIELNTFTPYLDKRVLDFILSLDHSLRTPVVDAAKGTFDFKYLQKQLALKLLPAEIFERPKQGGAINPFIHLEDSERLNAIKQHLAKSEYLNQFVRPGPVQGLFDDAQQNCVRIFLLLSMDIWYNLVAKRPLDPVIDAPSLKEYLES